MKIIFFVVLLIFALDGIGRAQVSVNGSLRGRVTDAAQSAVAGAKVMLIKRETSAVQSATTDAEGWYNFARVAPGTYTLTIEGDGFRRAVRENALVNVNETAIANVTLEVGAISETINVDADITVQSGRTDVSTLIDERRVREIPLNGRNFQRLVQLVPGVGGTNANSGVFNPSIAGARPSANSFILDGSGTSEERFAGGLAISGGAASLGDAAPSLISTEAIQEFRVITSNADATFGRSSGGQINIITRTGTNRFHGSAYEYLRNNVLDARDFFNTGPFRDRQGRAVTPPFRQHLFGGTLGGPIRRDRHFFFGSYEGFRQRLDQTTTGIAPNAALINLIPGDLRRLFRSYWIERGVVDPQNANIAGAIVKAVNTATNLERKTTTNSEGFFTLPLMPPGNYTLNVEQTGFASIDKRDVILNVGDQRSLLIQLRVSGVAEQVNVTDEASLVNESPAVGTVVNRQFVENLPLNGRSFQSLINLTPGVVQTPADEFGGGGQFSVNGQRANANYFTLDGVSANIGIGTGYVIGQGGAGSLPGLSAQGGTNNLVSIEALQEFCVLTSTFAPEFGRMPGGQVQIVTRSGTNQLRGTLFNYLRNDVFDANDFFSNANGLKRPALRQNDFGGVVGGPLFLPRFGEGGRPLMDGRNKAFFFFSYEGLRLRQPQSLLTTTPSLRIRKLAVPSLQTILNAFPLPTGAEFINRNTNRLTGTAPLAASYSDPSSLNATSIKVDYNLNDRVKIFGRYNYAPSDSARRGAAPFNAGTLSAVGQLNALTETLTLGSTQTISPRISNDFIFNRSRSSANSNYRIDNFAGAVAPSASTLLPSFVSAENALLFFDTRDAGVLSFGHDSLNANGQLNFVDNLSAVMDNHTLQFGIDYRRLTPTPGKSKDGKGTYSNFYNYAGISGNGEFTDDEAKNTPGLILSTLTGYSSTYSQYPAPTLIQNFSAYAQDTWRIGRRATLVYGLRYEVNPAPTGRDGVKFIPARNVPDKPVIAPPGTKLYETTWDNFAPRVGLSYLLSSKPGRETIIRGGAGVFYDLGIGQTLFAGSGYPYNAGNPLNGDRTTFPASAAFLNRSALGQSSGFSEVSAPDPNLKLPRVWQFNVAVEQSLGASQTISASYIGALGRRLTISEYIYANIPGFYAFVTTRNGASSDYHALQLQFQRRLSKGLQALVNYTWSHSLDNASSDTLLVGSNAGDLKLSRGNSDFDLRQILNAAATWNFPAPNAGRIGNSILRGFALDTVVNGRSAPVVNLIGGYAYGGASYRQARPDYVAGKPLYQFDKNAPGNRVFNPDAFKAPPTDADGNVTRQGTLGRGVLRGFDLWQVDLALRRQFNLTERVNLQFRPEAFNVLNHTNLARPVADISNPLFGQATSVFSRGLGVRAHNIVDCFLIEAWLTTSWTLKSDFSVLNVSNLRRSRSLCGFDADAGYHFDDE